MLEDHPNTYTFTKHLAEHEVAKCAALFPCSIVRPSMSAYNLFSFGTEFPPVYIKGFSLCSHRRVERAHSWLDDIQKRASRIRHGRFQRSHTANTPTVGYNRRLYSGRHCCERTISLCIQSCKRQVI